MSNIITSAGLHFTTKPGETLLEAATRQEIHFPYSCRTGRCSTCKAKVRSGTSTAKVEELGLSPAERAEGWILTCVRCADSDLQLDVTDLGDTPIPPTLTLPCRIQSLERIGADLLRVFLRLPPTSSLSFLPGQYVQVIGQGGLRRSYSLANGTPGLLELHIRAVPGGAMSQYWFEQAKTNDLLRLQGPLGTFFLRDIVDQDLVFLATGTGIAPVKAMLEGLAAADAKGRPRSVSVYWGGRTPGDLYWNPTDHHPGVHYSPVLSRAAADWDGTRGYVQDAFMASAPDWPRTRVYACGSDAMIQAAQHALVKAGLPAVAFLSDAFVCSAPD